MSTRRILVAITALILLSGTTAYANSLQVNAAAAMTGSFGLAVTLDPASPNNSVYVEKTGWDESSILTRWQWRRGDLVADTIDSKSFALMALLGHSTGGPTPGALQIMGRAYLSGKGHIIGQPPRAFFRLHAMCRNSNNSARFSNTLTIPKTLAGTGTNQTVQIEYELTNSTGTNFDGICCVRAIGVGERCRTDAQTYLNHITGVRFGAFGTGNLTTDADGTYNLDTFEAFR
jgi:hypothetical protein